MKLNIKDKIHCEFNNTDLKLATTQKLYCSHTYLYIFTAGSENMPEVLSYLIRHGMIPYWKRLGVLLGLPYADMEAVEAVRVRADERMMAMLSQWLRSGTATKQRLLDVLKIMN